MKESSEFKRNSANGLEEESKRMSEKIKELQLHMQKEKEKRQECVTGNLPDRKKTYSALNETSTSLSAIPEDECPVFSFLRTCGMERYHEMFIRYQVNTLLVLKGLKESDLEAMKIPIGHRLKILKNLRNLPDFSEKISAETVESEENKEGLFRLTENLRKVEVARGDKGPTETVLSFSIQPKIPCWGCLKVHPSEESKKCYQKSFCSEGCVQNFERMEKKVCKCGKEFLRKEGIFYQELWICNLCAEKIDY